MTEEEHLRVLHTKLRLLGFSSAAYVHNEFGAAIRGPRTRGGLLTSQSRGRSYIRCRRKEEGCVFRLMFEYGDEVRECAVDDEVGIAALIVNAGIGELP